MAKDLKVVVDTNVWISALVFGGKPEVILKLFIDGKITVIVSEEIITELRRIITTKFPLYISRLGLLEASIRDDAIIVPLGENTIRVSRDTDDNKIIETAVKGKADYIISGDDDLLVIKNYESTGILKPSNFLEVFYQN